MRLAIALIVMLSAGAGAGPREVELRKGESVADVAQRELGTRSAEGELRAFNRLGAGEVVAAGTRLLLPGPERDRALSALGAARNAVAQTGREGGAVSPQARARLDEAEAAFARADYSRAAQAADEAWRLVSELKPDSTSFTVEVDEGGGTTVDARSGTPVRVEAQGVQRTVTAGQRVKVAQGSPPSEPRTPPGAPTLAGPRADAMLRLKPDAKNLLGPVRLSWARAPGATEYLVEVLPLVDGRAPLTFRTVHSGVTLPPLPAGTYEWSVRAQNAPNLVSPPSSRWRFVLEADTDPLPLHVREPSWK